MKKIFKIAIITLYSLLLCLAIVFTRKMTLDDLIFYAPKNIFMATLFMLSLYIIKSVSVFFPIILLQIASGFLFSWPLALAVNICGIVIDTVIPYFIGMFSGAVAVEKRVNKDARLQKVFTRLHKHEFFLPFFLRIISCLPSDLIGMYFGANKFNFSKYLIATILGVLPGAIPATFMGRSITEPLSPQFIISVSITVTTALISVIVFYIYNKNQARKEQKKGM